MTRSDLKARIDELSDEEVAALVVLLGPSEDQLAASSPGLQTDLAAALAGELRGRTLAEVTRDPGATDVPSGTD